MTVFNSIHFFNRSKLLKRGIVFGFSCITAGLGLAGVVPAGFAQADNSAVHIKQAPGSSAGKIPVILVHGSWGAPKALKRITDKLDAEGIPWYSANFGRNPNALITKIPDLANETAPIESSANQLAGLIARIRRTTGQQQVNLFGHSEGAVIIKDYMVTHHDPNIKSVVYVNGTVHGTSVSGLSSAVGILPAKIRNQINRLSDAVVGNAFNEILPQSAFMRSLNNKPDAQPGVTYLALSSKDDTINTPYISAFLRPVPGATIFNQEVHSIPGVRGPVDHAHAVDNPAIVNRIVQFYNQYGEPA